MVSKTKRVKDNCPAIQYFKKIPWLPLDFHYFIEIPWQFKVPQAFEVAGHPKF